MNPRHLFGPVPPQFAAENLAGPRGDGGCRTFDVLGSADLLFSWHDSWDAVCNRLPDGWRPDFITLWLPYTVVPPWLWSAPVPIVGLAADWNLLWTGYRDIVHRCDAVLTDTGGVDALHRAGIKHARPAMLYGLGRSFLEPDSSTDGRDIDVLFVGNLHPHVQSERLPWIERLAELGDRFKVRIATNVFGDDYSRLLRRAR